MLNYSPQFSHLSSHKLFSAFTKSVYFPPESEKCKLHQQKFTHFTLNVIYIYYTYITSTYIQVSYAVYSALFFFFHFPYFRATQCSFTPYFSRLCNFLITHFNIILLLAHTLPIFRSRFKTLMGIIEHSFLNYFRRVYGMKIKCIKHYKKERGERWYS